MNSRCAQIRAQLQIHQYLRQCVNRSILQISVVLTKYDTSRLRHVQPDKPAGKPVDTMRDIARFGIYAFNRSGFSRHPNL
jgi:hypothetical protein